MKKLPEKDRAEYYHRCYKAVDGLWFVKAEEKYGFDAALGLDREVWKVMPRIQARFIKKKLEKSAGLDDLMECLSQKLLLDGFEFVAEKGMDREKTVSIEFKISACPWHHILVKSGRGHLSDRIGGVICGEEYRVWAEEFGKDTSFSFGGSRICREDSSCILRFRLSN